MVVSEFGAESILGWKNGAIKDRGMDYAEELPDEAGRHAFGVYPGPIASRVYERSVVLGLCRFPQCQRVSAVAIASAHRVVICNCKGLVTDDRQHKRLCSLVRQKFAGHE